MKCRCCGSNADQVFVDLGHQPPSNAYLTEAKLAEPEVTFPLRVYVCNECWLVQLPAHAASDELFNETYAYFSSVSSTWVAHAERYVAEMTERFSLDSNSFVVEVASNDGYLLQFVKQRGIRCLGIEPTHSTAVASREKGIETVEEFFGGQFASRMRDERGPADLLAGNNVLAHVPDLNDFVAGVSIALADDGVATFEFPHLMQLVGGLQFDTVYHEHYSYLSFYTVNRLFASHGLKCFDVQKLPTHGGSLRVFATPESGSAHSVSERVSAMLQSESDAGMQTVDYYSDFQPSVEKIKDDLLSFLIDLKRSGGNVCGYGAAAKGNTLLNFAGVKSDLLPFVCDAAPSKQEHYLPGSHIPVVHPDQLRLSSPENILVLPWNIAGEAQDQHRYVQEWGGKFWRAVPRLEALGNA